MARSFARLLWMGVALGLLGCGSKDSVSLTANVQNVQLAVTPRALGDELSGSFELYLEVGPEAPGDATVSLDAFLLVRDGKTILPSLDVSPQGASFPLVVGKGKSQTVTFTVQSPQGLLPAETKDELCAGPLTLSGAVSHNLEGESQKPVTGRAAQVDGC